VTIFVDGKPIPADESLTVAAALLNAGVTRFRSSGGGEPRGPLCAMGICFECRVTVDGTAHRRACMVFCREEMRVETSG